MKKIISILTILLFALSSLFAQKEAGDVRRGNREYKKQNFTAAEVDYRRALETNKNGYEAHYSEGKSYVIVDTFDSADEKQIKTRVDISDEACLEIFGIVEGCKILKKAASDPNVMDGFMDSSSSRFEARWEKEL